MDPTRFDYLLNRYLDGELSPDEKNELQNTLLSDPEARRQFWRDAQLHGSLRLLGEQEPGAREARKDFALTPETKVVRARRFWLGAAASAAAAVLAVFLGLLLTRPLSASAALQQIIDAASDAGDRSYEIQVMKGNAVREIGGGHQLRIDGATLYLRGSDQYVLIQDLDDRGQKRLTGFDGQHSWSMTGRGPARISRDPTRFRGNLPGEQQDATFINLRGQLEGLRSDYELTILDPEDDLHGLRAIKKSKQVRGPREIEAWFDPESGTLHRLDLAGLPQQKGGPSAVRIELLEERNLGSDFFSHTAHHEPDRGVIEESPN
ncbi:MAG: hypothetical protein VCA55_08105 [Verrucomicrobiales bacterium]